MREIPEESVPERRPRNDRRRARNRENLIKAAIDVAAELGSAALTPAAIARRAGLHKQAFYVHFKDIDECVAEAARRIASESSNAAEERHAELVRRPVRDRAGELREMCTQLEIARANGAVYRVLATERYSEGVVADTVRELIQRSRKLWTSVLLDVAMRGGISASALAEIENLASMLLELSMATVLRLLDDPKLSIEAEAERHIRFTEHLVRGELRALYRKQHGGRVGRA
ncbi:MAG TPA: helix-turn-helix domain-containing protein [Polyangiales bacterium]|jgi:AcrR family transcriptional regulator|nr:helix-turn-helix domain-containing protein [Polyangiales bacterium]